MLLHLIDFLVDYFTKLNAKKIAGGILFLIGLATLGQMNPARDMNSNTLYAIGGIVIGGVGLIVVYYDIAKDKTDGGPSELDTLSNAYKQQGHGGGKVATWHMNQDPGDNSGNKNTSDKN